MRTVIKLVKFMHCLPVNIQDGVIAVLKEAGLIIEDAELKRVATTPDKFQFLEGERAIVQYVSTRDMDREGEIVLPGGMNLAEFRRSPVVLWGHNYSEPPIGSDSAIESDGYGLKAKTIYATTARGNECWTLRKEGHLRTSSIGFVPLESVDVHDKGFTAALDAVCKDHAPTLAVRDKIQRITKRALLLEHSDVSVPCNPNALTLAVAKSLGLSDDMIKQLKIDASAKAEITMEEIMAWIDAHPEYEGDIMDHMDAMPKEEEHKAAPIVIRSPAIRVPTIRVCQEETLKEKTQFALDMARGKV